MRLLQRFHQCGVLTNKEGLEVKEPAQLYVLLDECAAVCLVGRIKLAFNTRAVTDPI